MATDLSNEACALFEVINYVSICGVVCTFGILTNIINLFIFWKQGFNNSVNIGFFAIAISDLLCLVALLWVSICLNPLLTSLDIPWLPLEVMYLSGAWPHVMFARITSFSTVYVTAERYVSIALPLKVKNILTRKTTTVILCLIYVVNLASMFPEYATTYLGWRVVSNRNETRIGILFTSSRRDVEGTVFVLHSILGMSSFAGVVIFTALLVFKLGQSSQWRQNVATSNSKREAASNRDKKTVKMVVLIACILIVCYTPGVVIALTAFIIGPEFNIRGEYTNICEAMWSTALTIQSINSSVNIFVYYSMSSKYRDTVHKFTFRSKCQ